MKYTSIALYRKMVVHAIHEGMQEQDFDVLPISVKAMEGIKAVPAELFFELHEFLDQRLGPGFSVRVGGEMKMDDYGVLGLSWKTCSKAGEIFERSERYFKLLSNTYDIKVENMGIYSCIRLNRPAYRRGVALSNEATFAATVVVLQAMTEQAIAPTQIAFQHKAPTDLHSFKTLFNCPILFEQDQNDMIYLTSDLETRTAKADTSIHRFLMERVEEEAKGIEISSIKIASDVEKLIRDALPSGIPSIVQIGQHMGMSSRTLNRRLSENGVSYRELVRQTQEKISKDLLKNTNYSISEIAFQTGFSEQSAFSRAFKRWSGQSPLVYRNPA